MLHVQHIEIPRFRDCFLHEGEIVIHTRTGGGNREEYELENHELTLVPGYLRDEDDSFDNTYANFYYEVPQKYKELIAMLQGSPMPSERWKQLWEELNKK